MPSAPGQAILEIQHPGTRAICITLVADAEIAAVYEAFGGRYGEARPLTQRDCEALREGLPEQLAVPLIRIGSGATACTPGGVFIIEDSSAEGARPEILREVSRGTQAVAVSLDPEGLPRLAWYREGRPAAAMIANAPGRVSGLGSAEIEQVIASAPGLRDRLSEVRRCAALPAVLELAARLTGVSLKPGWSEQALPGGIVLPVLDDAAPRAESAGAPDLPRPQAAALIEAAPDAAVAAAVPLQARRLAEDADLSRWPEALELIGLLASRPAHTDVTARTEHSPGRAPILWRDSSISLLIRRLSSSLHWHTVIDPSTDPEPPLRTVTTALGALRSAAAVFTGDEVPGEQGARVALHRLVSGRPNRLGPAAVVDLAADLGVPPPRRRPTARDEAARDNSRRHQEATAAVRGFAGRLPADGSWVAPAWPMPVPDLSPGHCLLLAADLSPDELLARAADGRPIESATVVGATGLGTAVPGTRARLAVGRVGSWSLLVEQGSSFTPGPKCSAESAQERACCALSTTRCSGFRTAKTGSWWTGSNRSFPSDGPAPIPAGWILISRRSDGSRR